MSLEIHYRKETDGIHIHRCFTGEDGLLLPVEIDGEPVTHLAPYAFSLYKRNETEDVKVYTNGAAPVFSQQLPLLAGNRIKTLSLPAGVKSLGAYLFYGCSALEYVSFSNQLETISAGVFTGCKLKTVEISFYDNQETSCLPEVAGELKHTFSAILNYYDNSGNRQVGKLIFPEFYEEDIEIATARIFESHCIGSGIYYRQCFLHQKIEFERYDSLFSLAVTQEPLPLVLELAFARVMYPLRLRPERQAEYIDFLKAHIDTLAIEFINQDRKEDLAGIDGLRLWSEERLAAAIDQAAVMQKVEMLAYLMDIKQRLYPVRRKKYEL